MIKKKVSKVGARHEAAKNNGTCKDDLQDETEECEEYMMEKGVLDGYVRERC